MAHVIPHRRPHRHDLPDRPRRSLRQLDRGSQHLQRLALLVLLEVDRRHRLVGHRLQFHRQRRRTGHHRKGRQCRLPVLLFGQHDAQAILRIAFLRLRRLRISDHTSGCLRRLIQRPFTHQIRRVPDLGRDLLRARDIICKIRRNLPLFSGEHHRGGKK